MIKLIVPIAILLTLPLAASAAAPEVALPRMRELLGQYKSKDLVSEFAAEDFSGWPPPAATEALRIRGQAFMAVKDGVKAEADFARAVALEPRNTILWIYRGDNLLRNLGDDARAMAAYDEVRTINGPSKGWDTITATIAMAGILTDQVRTAEALALLTPFGDGADLHPVWRVRLLRSLGAVYAAAGRDQESLASFRQALEVEAGRQPDGAGLGRPAAAKDMALQPAPLPPARKLRMLVSKTTSPR